MVFKESKSLERRLESKEQTVELAKIIDSHKGLITKKKEEETMTIEEDSMWGISAASTYAVTPEKEEIMAELVSSTEQKASLTSYLLGYGLDTYTTEEIVNLLLEDKKEEAILFAKSHLSLDLNETEKLIDKSIEILEKNNPKKRKKRKTKEQAEEQKLEEIKKMADKTIKDDVFGLNKEINAVEYAIEKNMPVLLIGETGTGKTHLIRSIAHKQKKELVRLSLNGEIGINEIIGKWLVKEGATYWQDGVLVDCVRNGKWIVVDEINSALPEVLFAIHSLLDDDKALVLAEKDGERLVAHEDFRLFAAMNPPDEYAGTREMNKALLSRFPVVLYIDYYSPRTELEIVTYHSGIDSKAGKILIDIASNIRKLKNEHKIWYTCSTRDIINAAKLLQGGKHSLSEILNWGIRNKASKEEWELIAGVFETSAAIPVDLSWKHQDIEKLTEDLTQDIEDLNKQKQELQDVIKTFESTFKGISERLTTPKI